MLYHFIGRCGNGFSVSGGPAQDQQICNDMTGCQKLWAGFRCNATPPQQNCTKPGEFDQKYCNDPDFCSNIWTSVRSSVFDKNNYMY